jgi:hypothetical protein
MKDRGRSGRRQRSARDGETRGEGAERAEGRPQSTRGGSASGVTSLLDRSPDWAAVLAILLLVAVFFHPLIFGGQVFSSPDAQAPQGFGVFAEEWRSRTGEYPTWNPYTFCGIPSYAALAYNPDVYFPDWIFKAPGTLAPPMLWLLTYYLVGAVALFHLVRDFGAARGPAALAGLLFALTPNLIAVGAHGHGSQLVNSGLIPLALLALHRFLARGRVIWLALFALTLGCQLLRGHVQIAYYTWLAVGVYLVIFLLNARRPASPYSLSIGKGLAGVAVGLFLAVLLGAVLVLPVMEYTPHSIRGGGPTGGVTLEYATGWSLGWAELLTLLVPSALGFGGETYWGTMPFTDYPNYMGILTLYFAVLALVLARGRAADQERRQGQARGATWDPATLFLFVLLVLGLLVALGKHFFLYELLYRFLPFWKKFRVPVMILVLTQLAAAGLFALGLTRVLALRRAPGSPRSASMARVLGRLAIAALGLFLVAVLFAGPIRSSYAAAFHSSPRISAQYARAPERAQALGERAARRAHSDLVRVLALVTLASAAGRLLIRGRLRPELYLGGVALLSAIDLAPIGQEIMGPLIAPRSVLMQTTEPDDITNFLTSRAAESGPFRVFPLEEFRSNRLATFGIASVGGYHAAKPRIYQEFMDAFGIDTMELFRHPDRYRILDLLNVRYLLTRLELGVSERFRLAYEGSFKAYENLAAGPRAFLVGEVVVESDAGAALSRLADPAFDLSTQAVVASEVGSLGGALVEGSARLVELGLNRVVVDVTSSAPALLVLGELFAPGWQATVDGERVPVVRADHIFRAVRVDSGSHRVEFQYVAPGLRLGFALSVTAAVGILVLGGGSLLVERRRAHPRIEDG